MASMHHFSRTGNRIDVLNRPQFASYCFFAPRNGFLHQCRIVNARFR